MLGSGWVRYFGDDHGPKYGFARAYKLGRYFDLREVSKKLSGGTVICSPSLLAGREHIEAILVQAKEYWSRNQFLARNKSIDLLMRATCKRQISEAVSASGISNVDRVALFGLIEKAESIDESESTLMSQVGTLKRRDELLLLDSQKVKFLKKFHGLPNWLERDQLLSMLRESSVTLIFSK
ncbi:MAG: KEOPS complex subunit Cgi121 [Nitrososphaerales archaeon]